MQYTLKLLNRQLTIKALKHEAESITDQFTKIIRLSQYCKELNGVIGKTESSSVYYSLFTPGGLIREPEKYQVELNDLINRLPEILTIENVKPFLPEIKTIFDNHIPIKDKRKTNADVLIQQAENTAREESRKLELSEWRQQFCQDKTISIPPDKMAVYLVLSYDDSDSMTDYFNPYCQIHDNMLLAIVPKQRQTESICRKILSYYANLSKYNWTWHTDNYSMGHGNYLLSEWTEHTEAIKGYDGRNGVRTRYEIKVNSYNREMLPYKDYPGIVESNKEEKPINLNSSITIRKNTEHNGIEILFPEKPDVAILDNLKSMGFRWSKYQSLWYAKFSDNLMTKVTELLNPLVKS